MVKVSNVVGEPILTLDGMTLIPLSKASFGFGGGGGDSRSGAKGALNAGSAAGVKIEPIGFLAVKDGSARVINISPSDNSSIEKVFDMMPQILDKLDHIIGGNR